MRARARFGAALGAVLLGASACSTTTLEFRDPEGSVLELGSDWHNPSRRIVFRSRVTLKQAHSYDDERGTPCHGEVRIDGEIDLTRLPPGASRYLVRDERGHKILVHGYYWIYRFEPTTSDEPAAHYVDISPQAIARLLEGLPVTITEESYEGNEIFRFELGIVLPESEREEPADTKPVTASAKKRRSMRRTR